MEINRFKRLIQIRGITIIKTNIPTKKIIELYKSTDFKCEINGKKCKKIKKQKMLCCKDCNTTIGYKKFIKKSQIEEIAEKYNTETGFWTENGCSLPIEHRSLICLSYYCGINNKAHKLSTITFKRKQQLTKKYKYKE